MHGVRHGAGGGLGQHDAPHQNGIDDRSRRQDAAIHIIRHRNRRKDGVAVAVQNQAFLNAHCVGFRHDVQLGFLRARRLLHERTQAVRCTGKHQRSADDVGHAHRVVLVEPAAGRADEPQVFLQQGAQLQGGIWL
ncbi:hypothetical protein D3C72_974180 [compost metagenome]